MFIYTCYPTPADALVTLTPDSTAVPIPAHPGVDHQGNPCQQAIVPTGTPSGHGAWVRVEAPGYVAMTPLHGMLTLADQVATLDHVDIFALQAATAPPDPGPTPPSTRTPQEIMAGIPAYLGTVPGCGIYTEDSGKALHEEHGPAWGHIRKDPAQHQYNGHAVDALMLLYPTKGVQPGVYDIVQNSSSPEAEKSFNWVGPPDPALWYYPPADPVAQALQDVRVLLARLVVAVEALAAR